MAIGRTENSNHELWSLTACGLGSVNHANRVQYGLDTYTRIMPRLRDFRCGSRTNMSGIVHTNFSSFLSLNVDS